MTPTAVSTHGTAVDRIGLQIVGQFLGGEGGVALQDQGGETCHVRRRLRGAAEPGSACREPTSHTHDVRFDPPVRRGTAAAVGLKGVDVRIVRGADGQDARAGAIRRGRDGVAEGEVLEAGKGIREDRELHPGRSGAAILLLHEGGVCPRVEDEPSDSLGRIIRRSAALSVGAGGNDLPRRASGRVVQELQVEVLRGAAPSVIPTHIDRQPRKCCEPEGLAFVGGHPLMALPLVVAVVVGVGERAVPGALRPVAGRVDPENPIVSSPFDRVERTGADRRCAVGGTVVRPADRVDDDLHALVLHPLDGALQVAVTGGIRDVQRSIRGDVHQGLGDEGAMVGAGPRIAIGQIARGSAERAVTAAGHGLRQFGPQPRAQPGEPVLVVVPRRIVDDADLDTLAREPGLLPDVGHVKSHALTGDRTPERLQRRDLAHPHHPGLPGELPQQRRRQVHLEVVR